MGGNYLGNVQNFRKHCMAAIRGYLYRKNNSYCNIFLMPAISPDGKLKVTLKVVTGTSDIGLPEYLICYN